MGRYFIYHRHCCFDTRTPSFLYYRWNKNKCICIRRVSTIERTRNKTRSTYLYVLFNRNTKLTHILIGMEDWYATFCGLAGVDPTDYSAAEGFFFSSHFWFLYSLIPVGLPPIDSHGIYLYDTAYPPLILLYRYVASLIRKKQDKSKSRISNRIFQWQQWDRRGSTGNHCASLQSIFFIINYFSILTFRIASFGAC